jgi:hypothetical protein
LYDTDILAWSKHQAALLKRRAAGELVNEADLDWANIAEGIESVGSEQRHAVESLLLRALVHMLKAEAWPISREVPHWQAEARLFCSQARRRFVPSMRQRIDLAGLYADALGDREPQCRAAGAWPACSDPHASPMVGSPHDLYKTAR